MRKIVICGSMAFSQAMINTEKELKAYGFEVVLPDDIEQYIDGKWEKKLASGWNSQVEGAKRKIENNLIKRHYEEIKNADAILVINQNKKGIKNYIGGNTFLEMSFAFVLNKNIFVLNRLPEELTLIYQELVAMQPIVLEGDLTKITDNF